MKISFDQNLPIGLRHLLGNREVRTAEEQGWSQLLNGDLLQAAEANGFDLLLTADQSLAYQQNLSGRRLTIGILTSNHWPSVRAASRAIAEAVEASAPGSFFVVTVQRISD